MLIQEKNLCNSHESRDYLTENVYKLGSLSQIYYTIYYIYFLDLNKIVENIVYKITPQSK